MLARDGGRPGDAGAEQASSVPPPQILCVCRDRAPQCIGPPDWRPLLHLRGEKFLLEHHLTGISQKELKTVGAPCPASANK